MAYEPTTWQAGDTVTSAKLNKIEQGIAKGGIRIVHLIDTGEVSNATQMPIMRLDITPSDLEEMLNNGQMPMLYTETESGINYISLYAYNIDLYQGEYDGSTCTFGINQGFISPDPDEYFFNESSTSIVPK